MAIDMKAMRAKLSALKNGGGNRNVFWRPQDGDQDIRIVSPADGDPFKDFYFHYNVGNNSGFLCPKKNFGDDCAVCSFVRSLYDEGTEESIKMAKSLTARQRFFSPVVVRGEEKEGVRIWGYGKTAYETLLNLVLNLFCLDSKEERILHLVVVKKEHLIITHKQQEVLVNQN